MRKMLLTLLVFGACIVLGAKDIRDTWFETFYRGTAKNIPAGCSIRKDVKTRIIFIDMPLPTNIKTFDAKKGKEAVIAKIKGTADADFMKKAQITVIYNYITPARKIFSIVISSKDF